MENDSLKGLLRNYMADSISDEDQTALWMEVAVEENRMRIGELIRELSEDNRAEDQYRSEDWEDVLSFIFHEGKQKGRYGNKVGKMAPLRFLPQWPAWGWVAGAAILLLAVSVLGIWVLRTPPHSTPEKPVEYSGKDIVPGQDKAVLTLSGGQQIILDSAQRGLLTVQGTSRIFKGDDGKISYAPAFGSEETGGAGIGDGEPILFNTLTTLRGGQYRLTLPDGSKVWLNAASSIYYPTVFTGKERRVAISGEVYFEVARVTGRGRQEKMPFIVEIKTPSGTGGEVLVTGTHFNINAYPDEKAIQTTLLEGGINLKKDDRSFLLKPGQQAQLGKDGSIKIMEQVDTLQVVAWKNGFFNFNNADLLTVMRQLSRWYNVDVVYEGDIPPLRFLGEMERGLKLSDVLDVLKRSDVHFKIDGRKIIVFP